MGIFLSTYVNKVDKKGRVSIPAAFRATLGAGQTEIVIYPSLTDNALDACSMAHMESLAKALRRPGMDPKERELIDTVVFGQSINVSMDTEGRISVPADLQELAGITDTVTFHGRREIFQLWNPDAFKIHQQAARDMARAKQLSLSNVLASFGEA